MTMLARLLTVVVSTALALPSGALAQAFQSVDPPDAAYTLALGVRNGTVVGLYQDLQAQFHGFELTRRGSYASFDAPGADPQFGTYAIGLDIHGNIVGYFYDTGTSSHGFVRLRNGMIITFDARGANAAGTLVAAVNRVGTLVGTYLDAGGAMHGFARSTDGEQWHIDVPGAQMTQPTWINDKGVIVGKFADQTGTLHGFVHEANEPEDFQTFDAAVGCFLDVYYPVYLNDHGDIATTCLTDSGTSAHGYLRTRTGQVTRIDYPGNMNTAVNGITRTGDVVGGYLDSHGVNHGFVRSPNGTFTTYDFPGASVTTPFSSDAAGDIVGTYQVLYGPLHGFVRRGRASSCPECEAE